MMKLATLCLTSLIVSVTSASDQCGPEQYNPCEAGYEFNPFSNSCLRFVRTPKPWHDANQVCRNAGEQLAVLNDLNSIYWFRNLRRVNKAWMNEAVWIGARQYNGAWCWAGASELNGDTPPFLLADWEKPQPDGSGGIDSCVQVFTKARDTRWDDTGCEHKRCFICERRMTDPIPVMFDSMPPLPEKRAWKQDRVASYLRFMNIPALTEITFSFYYKPIGDPNFSDGWIMSVASPGSGELNNGFILGIRNNILRLHNCQGTTNNIASGVSNLQAFKEPHRHVFVYDANTIKWYFDKKHPGVLELASSSTHDGSCFINKGSALVPLNDQDRLGGGIVHGQMFKGILADLQVWDHALSDTQVTSLDCTAEGNLIKFNQLEVVGAEQWVDNDFRCAPAPADDDVVMNIYGR